MSLAAALVASGPALAGGGQTNSASEGAQSAFELGLQALRDGRWEAARQYFQQAYSLSGRASVLLNLAAAEVHGGHLLAARASYDRFLAETSDPNELGAPMQASQRQAAERVRGEMDRRIPRVRMEIAHAAIAIPVRLELDGESTTLPQAQASKTDGLLVVTRSVDPGPHLVRVTQQNRSQSLRFAVAEGEQRTLRLALETDVTLPNATNVERRPEGRWWRSPYLWSGLAVITSVVAVSVVLASTPDTVRGNVPPGQVELP